MHSLYCLQVANNVGFVDVTRCIVEVYRIHSLWVLGSCTLKGFASIPSQITFLNPVVEETLPMLSQG